MAVTQMDNPEPDYAICAEGVSSVVNDLSSLGEAPANGDAVHRLEIALLEGRYADCMDLGREHGDRAVQDLYLPVIRRLETHWQSDSVAFGDLSFAFFQLQRLIARATEPPVAAPAPGRILVALARGEGHGFGAQILAAELALHGWTVNLDLSGDAVILLRLVAKHRFLALGLSVGHDKALDGLADLITDLRRESCHPGMAVMLGGNALVEPRDQYRFLGADAICATPAEATRWLSRRYSARNPLFRN